MAESFRDKKRDLNEAEKAHLQAVRVAADALAAAFNRDSPDPFCMGEAHKKLKEAMFWAVEGIERGITL